MGKYGFLIVSAALQVLSSWVVLLYTLAIPALSIAVLKKTGRLQSWHLDSQSDRVVPLVIGTVCYILCAVTIGRIVSAEILRRMMLAGACCEMMCLAVNYHWKISLHMTAIGGCTAVLTVLCFITGHLTGMLALAVVLSGLLAAARLYLGKHNPLQVAAGYAGGFAVTVLALLLLLL